MNSEEIQNKLTRIAHEVLAAGDYVYDPKHVNRPHEGGTWYKTEKGWTIHKPRKNPKKTTPIHPDKANQPMKSSDLRKRADKGDNAAKRILDSRKILRHDFCVDAIGDEETYEQMKDYKKAIGEKKGWGRSPQQVKQDFIRGMNPAKYDSPEAFQKAKQRIMQMPTKKFDALLAVVYNKDEEAMDTPFDEKL